MVFVLKDGETLHGTIEWYDESCLKINRDGDPNLLLYKSQKVHVEGRVGLSAIGGFGLVTGTQRQSILTAPAGAAKRRFSSSVSGITGGTQIQWPS